MKNIDWEFIIFIIFGAGIFLFIMMLFSFLYFVHQNCMQTCIDKQHSTEECIKVCN